MPPNRQKTAEIMPLTSSSATNQEKTRLNPAWLKVTFSAQIRINSDKKK